MWNQESYSKKFILIVCLDFQDDCIVLLHLSAGQTKTDPRILVTCKIRGSVFAGSNRSENHSLDLTAGELPDEVDRAGAEFADDVNERSVGVELYLARLRGEG